MRRYKAKNRLILLVILLLGLGVGYSLLSQDLTISGISKTKGNTWNIHFNNVQINSNSVTLSDGDSPATINASDNTLVEYTVTFNVPGDFYEFTVDVVNEGTIDGMIGEIIYQLNGSAISNENPLPEYLTYSMTYEDGIAIAPNHLLEAGNTETIKVRIEFKRDITNSVLPSTLQTNNFSFGINYIQSENNAITVIHPVCRRATRLHPDSQEGVFGSLGTEGVLTPGDAFDCDVNDDRIFDSNTERFYYLSPVDVNENSEYAALIYYNNVSGGTPNNTATFQYAPSIGFDTGSFPGPETAYLQLPTTLQWSNNKLQESFERQIKTIIGNSYVTHDGMDYSLPLFTYTDRAARLATYNEIVYACGTSSTPNTNYYLNSCSFLKENDTVQYVWLESYSRNTYYVYNLSYVYYKVGTNVPTALAGVRPVIEVNKIYIDY